MANDLSFMLLHRRSYEQTPRVITIRRSLIPRILRAITGGCVAGVVAIAVLPIPVAVGVAVLATAAAYALLARAVAVLDGNERVLLVRSNLLAAGPWRTDRFPFEALERFHTIERRDEESRAATSAELLLGPRLVTRYEVYTRIRGASVALADFTNKTDAVELVEEMNRLIAPRAP